MSLIPCPHPQACRVSTGHRPGSADARDCAKNDPTRGAVEVPEVSFATQGARDKALIESLSPAGWPRPRAQVTTRDGVTKEWPIPWMSSVKEHWKTGETVITLDAFDLNRAYDGIELMLCQVCGKPCRQQAFAPMSAKDVDEHGNAYSSGTPCCSLRCAKLALAMCPHFKEGSVIATFDISEVSFDDVDTAFGVDNWETVEQGSGD